MPSPTVTLGADPAPTMGIERVESVLGDVPLESLMTVARRDNPKRAVLVVSRVLGKHLNVAPTLAVLAGSALGQLAANALGSSRPPVEVARLADALGGGMAPALVPAACDGPPAIVLGYAETATALGHLVRRALGPGPLLHTTRYLAPAGALLSVTEPHSHATEHLLFHDDPHVLRSDAPVVLVDDELTTGRTAINTIRALHRVAPRRHYVIATLLDWRSAGAREQLDQVAGELAVRIDAVSLVSGFASIVEDRHRVPTQVPAGRSRSPGPLPAVPEVALHLGVPATARRGWTEREQADVERSCLRVSAELEGRRSGPRLLVLGTEELMFVPMLLAAHQSGDVRVRSTTRSPILVSSQPGYPIREGVAYEATDGTSGRRYLYNLTSDAVDDVFLCCEDAAAYRHSGLVAALLERHPRLHLLEVGP